MQPNIGSNISCLETEVGLLSPDLIQKVPKRRVLNVILTINKHHIQRGEGIIQRIFHHEPPVNVHLDNGTGQIAAANAGTDVRDHGAERVQNGQPVHIG